MRWRSAVMFAWLLPLVGCVSPMYLPPPVVIVHSSPAEEPAARPDPKLLPKKNGKGANPKGDPLPAPKAVPPERRVDPGTEPLPAPRSAQPIGLDPPRVEVLRVEPAPEAPFEIEPLVVPAIPAPTPMLPSVPAPPAPLPPSERP